MTRARPVILVDQFGAYVAAGGGGGGGGNVNLISVGGNAISLGQDSVVTGTSSVPVVLPLNYTMAISGSVTATLGALVAGSAIIGKVGIDQTAGQNIVLLAAGTALAGKFSIDQATANANNVQQIPGTSGGLSCTTVAVPANTTGVLISTGAHQVYHFACINISTTPYYLKLYNKATAPTVGSDTPVYVMGIPGPPSGGGGFAVSVPDGLNLFPLGLGYGVTAGIADSDTTAPTVSTCRVNIGWK